MLPHHKRSRFYAAGILSGAMPCDGHPYIFDCDIAIETDGNIYEFRLYRAKDFDAVWSWLEESAAQSPNAIAVYQIKGGGERA